MDAKNCPYIGIKEDPSTFLNFPSEGNVCMRTEPAHQIDLAHQSAYCLNTQYQSCPIYLRDLSTQNKEKGHGHKWTNKKTFRFWVPLIILIAIFLLVTGVLTSTDLLASSLSIGPKNTDKQSITNERKESEVVGIIGNDNKSMIATYTHMQTLFVSDTCPQPENWVYYFIQDGDSIERIAKENNLSIQQLLEMNCLNDIEELVPGLMILLPKDPDELTPSATSTLTNTPTTTETNTPTLTVTNTVTKTPEPSMTPTRRVQTTSIVKPTKPPVPTSQPTPVPPSPTPPVERPTPTMPPRPQ